MPTDVRDLTIGRVGGAVGAPRAPRAYLISKRTMDVGLGLLVLLLLSPLMLVAAIAVAATSPGPVLFRQTRIGQGGRPFQMLKFRTMRVGADDQLHRDYNARELRGEIEPEENGVFKPSGDPRITRVGAVLRAYSIDELPQLLNVLRGEMSLVGPRPSLPWEAELFTPAQRVREQCPPGLTGLWQVSGRNRLSMPQMLMLDRKYVHARSLRLDLWILLKTPRAVLAKDTS